MPNSNLLDNIINFNYIIKIFYRFLTTLIKDYISRFSCDSGSSHCRNSFPSSDNDNRIPYFSFSFVARNHTPFPCWLIGIIREEDTI